MAQKLITKAAFAREAGIASSTVTDLTKPGARLHPAIVGGRVDAGHPLVIEYMKRPRRPQRVEGPPPAPGIDPLYNKAVEVCRAAGKVTRAAICRELRVSKERGSKLYRQLLNADIIPTATTEPAKKRPARSTPMRSNQQTSRRPPPAQPSAPPAPDELPPTDEWPGAEIDQLNDLTLRELVTRFGTSTRLYDWLRARKTIVDIVAKEIENAKKRKSLVPREYVESFIVGPFERAHINLLTDGARTISHKLVSAVAAGATTEDCEKLVSDEIGKHIRSAKGAAKRAFEALDDET